MIEPQQGVLLISDPFLLDLNFSRTVILICEHNEEGTIGFVINRKYEIPISQLIPELKNISIPLFYGGPVQMDVLHFLHQHPDKIPGGIEIANGIYWGGDFEILVNLIIKQLIDTNSIRLFIGYSGWSSGQLNEEINEKSWLCLESSQALIFQKKQDDIWKEALKQMGKKYEYLINSPLDPQLN